MLLPLMEFLHHRVVHLPIAGTGHEIKNQQPSGDCADSQQRHYRQFFVEAQFFGKDHRDDAENVQNHCDAHQNRAAAAVALLFGLDIRRCLVGEICKHLADVAHPGHGSIIGVVRRHAGSDQVVVFIVEVGGDFLLQLHSLLCARRVLEQPAYIFLNVFVHVDTTFLYKMIWFNGIPVWAAGGSGCRSVPWHCPSPAGIAGRCAAPVR